MASAPYPLTTQEGLIASPFPIRQFEVRNLTPAAIYLKAGGAIPTAQNRDWIFMPGEERMGPPVHLTSLAWKLSAIQTVAPPMIIIYDEVQSPYLSLRDLEEQCPNYPHTFTTKDAWVILPTISPNGHTPVAFWIHAAYSAGEEAILLAHDLVVGATTGGAQLMYACTRAGVFSYGFPEPYTIEPKAFVRKGTEPGAGDVNVTIDAWYTNRPHYWRPEVNQYDPRPTLGVISAAGSNLFYYGLMPGYWDYSILYTAAAATTATVEVRGEVFIDNGGGVKDQIYVPTTATISLPITATLAPLFRRLLTIQHPQIVKVTLANTGANALSFMTMMRKL